jgi:hypothetical protein
MIRSLVVQDVLGVRHIQPYVNKKASIVMNFRAHTRNRAKCPGKRTFYGSKRFAHTEDVPRTFGIVCVCDCLKSEQPPSASAYGWD